MLYLSDSPEPKEIRELGERAVNDDSVYRDNVVDDYNYYFGDQWPEGDKRALDRQLRPHLEINRVKHLINSTSLAVSYGGTIGFFVFVKNMIIC